MSAISVLMPVYNAQSYLELALESVLLQTFSDFELIVVDDGSTDTSLTILNRFAQQDSRIRVLSRPNTGIVGALNDGLAICSGKYIARMDADDLCAPQRFEMQVRELESNSLLVAIGSCAIAIDPDGDELGVMGLPLSHEEIEASHLSGVSAIFHPAVMVRGDALRTLGYRNSAFPAEDLDLWLRLGEIGCLENLPVPLFIWRRTLDGIVASSQDKQRCALEWILKDCWSRRGLSMALPKLEVRPLVKSDLLRQWGWIALKNGNLTTSRKYAMHSFFTDPINPKSLKLAICAIRGY